MLLLLACAEPGSKPILDESGHPVADDTDRWTGEAALPDADATLVGDSQGNRVGMAMIGGVDYDGDGVGDFVIGGDGMRHGAGAAWVLPDTTRGTFPLATSPVRLDGDDDDDQFGHIVVHAGDLDGDGLPDLLAGAALADTSAADIGIATIFYGPLTSGTVSERGVVIEGLLASDHAGHGLAGLGDMDGDGLDDFAVTAEFGDAGGVDSGAVYIFLAAPTAPTSIADADYVLLGAAPNDRAGHNVPPPDDFDGDGHLDLLVCAPEAASETGVSGALYVVAGPVSASGTLADATATYTGEADGDRAGHHAISLGDVDGDDHSDIAISAYYADASGADSGAAYIVTSPHVGVVSLTDAFARWDGEAADDQAGAHVAAPDVDGDGVRDLLFGAWQNDTAGTDAGAAYLVYAPFDAGHHAAADADLVFRGEAAGNLLGFSVTTPGDIDADGYDDLLLGASQGGASTGVAYLWLGR